MSERYVHGYTDREQDRLVSQSLFLERWMYEGIDFTHERSLLEVGCGVGAQLKILLRRFPDLTVTGVDHAAKQVEKAQAFLEGDIAAGRAVVSLAEGSRLGFEGGSFDAAFLMWVLEHAHDPLPLLRELRRVVLPGGRLVCSEVFNASIFIRPLCPAFERYFAAFNGLQIELGGDPHIGVRLGSILDEAGWTDVDVQPVVILMDKRWREMKERVAFMDYWRELLLSGAAGLVESGRVTQSLVAEMGRELSLIPGEPEAMFYVTAIQASARTPLTQ